MKNIISSDISKLGDDAKGILGDRELDAATGGAFDAFANFGDIKGESTDKDHKDWVTLISWTGR
jgi:hypothetical protein